MSDLQKSPQGFLGALNLKILGLNPRQVNPALAAIFDARDMYLVDLAAQYAASGTLTVASDVVEAILTTATLAGTAAAQQPTAFLARFQHLIIDTNAADVAARYAMYFKRPQDTNRNFVGGISNLLAVTGTLAVLTYEFTTPGLLLLPGSRIGAQCMVAPAAGRATTVLVSGYTIP